MCHKLKTGNVCCLQSESCSSVLQQACFKSWNFYFEGEQNNRHIFPTQPKDASWSWTSLQGHKWLRRYWDVIQGSVTWLGGHVTVKTSLETSLFEFKQGFFSALAKISTLNSFCVYPASPFIIHVHMLHIHPHPKLLPTHTRSTVTHQSGCKQKTPALSSPFPTSPVFTDPGDSHAIWLFCGVIDVSYTAVVCIHMKAQITIDLLMHGIVQWICKAALYRRASEGLAVSDIISKLQVFDSCCPDRTPENCKWDVISTNNPDSVPAEKQPPHPTPPNATLTKFLTPPRCPCQSSSSPFPSLYLLISAGFGTKSHLGLATCQLRWAFTQTRQLLFNICLPWSKTLVFTP